MWRRTLKVQVTSDAAVIAAADRVVMPGQGAMPDCMREFTARGLREAVLKATAEKPFLGICVGEQMLFGHAEEGNVMGLEIMPGSIPRFPAGLCRCHWRAAQGAAHGMERSAADAVACLVEGDSRWRALLLRAQLFRAAG